MANANLNPTLINITILTLLIANYQNGVNGLLTWPRFYNGTFFSPDTNTQPSLSSVDNSSTSLPYKTEIGSHGLELEEAPQSLEVAGELEQSSSSPPPSPTPSRTSINDELESLCKNGGLTSSNHLHAHPHLCTKYIQCGPSGTMFLKSCGPGTVFNPEMNVCDWPRNVAGCHNGDDEDNNSLDDGNDDLHRSIRRRRSPRKGDSGFTGISPDPKHCNKYRLLSSAGGHYSTHKCGAGTLFNPLSSVCDFADNVDCSGRIADFGRYACSSGDNYRAPHPDLCDKFVECDRGTLAVKACPPGTLYGREQEKCEHSYKVHCRKRVSLEYDIARVRNKRQANRLNLACDFNYIAPHPHNCHQFVECEQRRIFIKNCGPGTAFNPRLGQCDWPHNVRQADPQDCTKYRQCVRSRYETRFCGQGYIYDGSLGACRPPKDYRDQECRRGGYPSPTTTTTENYDYDRPIVTPKPS